MNTENTLNEHQGHWMLAKLGKRVLRPGGRELTEKLIAGLEITPEDDIVELHQDWDLQPILPVAIIPKAIQG